ncbi:MAG: hypothetical protein ACYC1Q_11900, partial [Bacteroidia bacterium]
MKKLFILLAYFTGPLSFGQVVNMYIPYTLIDDLANASFDRTAGLMDQAIIQKQIVAYFDSGLTKPISVPQF